MCKYTLLVTGNTKIKAPGTCTVFAESGEELNTILMEIKVFTFTVMEIAII